VGVLSAAIEKKFYFFGYEQIVASLHLFWGNLMQTQSAVAHLGIFMLRPRFNILPEISSISAGFDILSKREVILAALNGL
jgi:hypothetical protein